MLTTTHNSDDYDDTIINLNLKKLANFDTPRTNFEKFRNKFTFCSEQVKYPLFLRKLKAFGWWVGFDLSDCRQLSIF